MIPNSIPTVDPTNLDTIPGAFREILKKFGMSLEGAMFGTVKTFDRNTNRVDVQPISNLVTASGATLTRALVTGLPVFMLAGGGFLLNFNLNPGDSGLIIAGDRDPTTYLKSGVPERPFTNEIKKYSFGLFFPSLLIQQFTIAAEDVNNVVLQSLDSTTKISLGAGTVKVQGANSVTVSGANSVTINGGNSLEASATNISLTGLTAITGNTTITGNLRVVGVITASGTITPNVP